MSALDREKIDHLCRIMDDRWTREMNEIRAVAERSRDERRQEALVGRAADRLDAALVEIAQSADYAIVRQDIEDVRDIDAARKRVAAGTYGVCTDCGGQIGYERLLAYPTAKRCIGCQQELERKRATREGHSAL
jgi:RNA polymerase-binding transcription factor DksA